MTLRTLISQISTALGTTGKSVSAILSIVALTGLVYGAGMKKQSKIHKETSYESKIDRLIESDSIKVLKINGISDTLKMILDAQSAIIEKQEEAKSAYNSLRGVVLDHVSKDKAMTIEQFKQYIETAPELKKNFSQIGSE